MTTFGTDRHVQGRVRRQPRACRVGVAGHEAVGQLLPDVRGLAAVLGDDQIQVSEEPAEVHGPLTPADSVEINDSADRIAGEEYLRRGEVSVTQHRSGAVAFGTDAINRAGAIQQGPNVVRGSRPHLLRDVELDIKLAGEMSDRSHRCRSLPDAVKAATHAAGRAHRCVRGATGWS